MHGGTMCDLQGQLQEAWRMACCAAPHPLLQKRFLAEADRPTASQNHTYSIIEQHRQLIGSTARQRVMHALITPPQNAGECHDRD